METFLCKSISTTQKALNDNVYKPLTIKFYHWLKVLLFYLLGLWIPSLLSAVKNFLISLKVWIFGNIVNPIVNFFIAIKNGAIYVLFGHWIPPLKRYICLKIDYFRSWIYLKILQPIVRFLIKFKNVIVYCFGGYWIPPLLEKLKYHWSLFRDELQRHYIDPFVRKMIDTKNFLTYWVLGYWIPPLIEKCRTFVKDCRQRFYEFIVKPIVNFFSDFTNNMIYVLTGKWIPRLLRFLNKRVFTPIFDVIFRLIDLSIYIFMGYFIPDLLRYVSVKRVQLRDYLIKNYMSPIKIYFIESVINIKRSILILVKQTKEKIVEFVKRIRHKCTEFYFELISLAKLTWRNFNLYMYKDVWLPTKRKARRSLLRTKLYLKYKVLLPSIKNILLGTIYSLEFLCVGILVPLCEFTVQKCHELLQIFMARYGYQYWDWVLEQLPDKSPFCDDSDTELKDFLPGENAHESSDEEEGQEFDQKRQHQEFANDSAFSSTDDEAEFSRNLQMPSLEHVDSDEEQELAFAPVEEKAKVEKSKRRKHPSTKNMSPSKQQRFSAISILPGFSFGFGSVISSAASYAFSKAMETPSMLGLQSKRNNSEDDEINADFEFLNDQNDDC
uniref:Uncharacterized protein n=1 Tax=Romanomermis culicivorax TaxID=13658 RepID=A0A915J7U6_ROMCU